MFVVPVNASTGNEQSGGGGSTQNQRNVDVVAVYGVSNAGVADCSAALQTALDALAGSGKVAWLKAGTYLVEAQINIPPGGVEIQLGSGATIEANIAGSGFNGSTLFYGAIPTASSSTTLNGANTVGSNQLTVHAAIATNAWIEVASAAHPFVSTTFYVETGGSTTITLDRPCMWTFADGDTVSVLSTPPPRLTLVGAAGASMQGACVGFVYGCFWQSVVQGIVCTNINGTSFDAVLVWAYGSVGCTFLDCTVDAFATANANAGLGIGGDACGVVNCNVFNVADGGAIKIVDSRNARVVGCCTANSLYGLFVTSDAASPYGAAYFQVDDFAANQCGTGASFIYGSYGQIDDLEVEATTGSYGVYVNNGPSITGNTTTLQFGRVQSSGGTLASSVSSAGTTGFFVTANCTDITVEDLTTDNNSGAGITSLSPLWVGKHRCYTSANATFVNTTCLNAQANTVIGFCDYNGSAGSFHVQMAASATLKILSGQIQVKTGGIGVLCNVGETIVGDLTLLPASGATGTTGFDVAGGTLRALPGCNPHACATPVTVTSGYYNRGTFNSSNGATAVAWPNLRETDQVLVMPTAAAATGYLSAQTPGTGFSWTDTGVHPYEYAIL